MQIALVRGDERDMRELERVVEHAHRAREPTKIGLIANHDGIVATLSHHLTHASDTAGRPIEHFRHGDPFSHLLFKKFGARGQVGLGVAL